MIITNKEARTKILAGVQKLCDVVGLTLGPKGRNVIIERQNATPLITNDGVTIARCVRLEDNFENLGAKVLLQASTQTNQSAGDGTTSSIVLGAAIMQNGMKAIELGINPIMLKEGLLAAAKAATEEIEKNSIEPTQELLTSIAINSCSNQQDGTIVAHAFEKVGIDGVITVEESPTLGTTLSITDGCELDATLASPLFTTNPARMETIYENTKLLIINKKLSSLKDFLPLLEEISRDKTPLVILAPDFAPEVIQALVVNKLRAGLSVAALKWVHADRAHASARDIAALCDTQVDEESGTCVTTVQKITCGMNSSTIVNPKNEKLAKRLESIKTQIDSEKDEYTRDRIKRRMAKLNGSIAIIQIGCSTDIETKEKKLRIEDAIAATKAAATAGITEGGGMSYLRAKCALEKYNFSPSLQGGAKVLIDSLDCITRKIAENAGVCPNVVISNVAGYSFGYNALDNTYENLAEAQIVDPTLVVTSVIKNAVSASATLLTTDAIITTG